MQGLERGRSDDGGDPVKQRAQGTLLVPEHLRVLRPASRRDEYHQLDSALHVAAPEAIHQHLHLPRLHRHQSDEQGGVPDSLGNGACTHPRADCRV